MPDTDATNTIDPPPSRHPLGAELHRQPGVAQHDVEVPVPVLVVEVDERGVAGHADDVDEAVDATERGLGVGEEPLGVGALRGVAGPGDAADLVGDVGREVLVLVDAERARADRRSGRGWPGGRCPVRPR